MPFWRVRSGGSRPYVSTGATNVKMREAGRIVPVAVIIAVGVNTDVVRDVPGMKVGPARPNCFG
jgi:putative transposase